MGEIEAISAKVAARIERAAQTAYEDLMRRVKAGEDARLATLAVQASFNGDFAGATAAAFTAVLQREVTPGHILALPVGDVVLSQRLHQMNAEMANTVSAVIRTHAQGMQSARDLARHLYDGYNPKDGILRPLEGATRAELPKALKALTDDRLTRSELQRVYEYGQKAASRLKTEAMKAAYMQAFDAWANDGGEKALSRALWVAQREKNRYAANRIAQTELARAHQDKVGREFMADPELSVVQVKMNAMHPLFDVCDYHSGADLFGLGKGLYPKAKAPKPPFHPHCWCRLVSRPDKHASADLAQQQGAVQKYLKSLPPEQAARVLGSRANFERVLRGATVDDVLNESVVKAYHVSRLGQLDLSVASFMAEGGKVAPMKIDIDLRSEAKLNKNDGDARAYVLGNGRRTGNEYLYAYDDASNKVIATHTDNLPNGVSTPAAIKPMLSDSWRRLVFHHNHPNSLPPSAHDLTFLGESEGILSAVVHGHDGSFYKIEPLQRGNVIRSIETASEVARLASRHPEFATMNEDDYLWVIAASRLEALRMAGVIKLFSNVLRNGQAYKSELETMTDLMYSAILNLIGNR